MFPFWVPNVARVVPNLVMAAGMFNLVRDNYVPPTKRKPGQERTLSLLIEGSAQTRLLDVATVE